jgi:hypothetical protein
MELPRPFPPFSTKGAAKPRAHVKHKFTADEDERLTDIVTRYGESNWKNIAAQLGGRTCRQCRERWKNYLDPNLNKDPWTAAEDELLIAQYAALGSQWSLIAKHFPFRTDVACKNRWVVLTSHTDQPKRVRGKGQRQPEKDADSDTWGWGELEVRQAYEDADEFAGYEAGFTFN